MPRENKRVTQPGTEIVRQLPWNDDAPAAARALVRTLLAGITQISAQRAGELTLAVSELVANAVRHAPPGPVDVRLLASNGTIRVEVADAGTVPFELPAAGNGHWGLRLTQEFSDRFGIERLPSTCVWCEFDVAQA